MNLKVIIMCIMFVQTSASFFDDFRGAMYSVEDSFGKLVNDVVSDVRETIGCTILAVKQVLALGGVFHESSDYNTRCRDPGEEGRHSGVQESDYSPKSPVSSAPILRTVNEASEKSPSEKMSEHIDESVARVSDNVFDMIGSYSDQDQIRHNQLKSINKRLSDISALLHREWNNISEGVRKQFGRLELDYFNPTIEEIWNDIKALHEIEQRYRNSQDGIGIRHILDEILSALREPDNGSGASREETNENDSDKTFALIETQFENMEEVEQSQQTDPVENTSVTELKGNEKKVTDESPLTFKGVAKKIMDETRNSFRYADGSSQDYEQIAPVTTERIMTTEPSSYENVMGSSDYSSLLAPKNSRARKEAVDEAKSLIENSKRTDAMMSQLLNKADKVGTSVFDDPDLLNFG